MIDVATGAVVAQIPDVHDAPVNRLFCWENVLASGDDEGCVKIWDLKQKACVYEFNENEDFISGFALRPQKNALLATSGDGRLSVINLRKGEMQAKSEEHEDEFLSVLVMKHGRKVVCGGQSGSVHFFSWGQFEKHNDVLSGHPQSIDTMIKVDEETIITGSSDGLIRIVSLFPKKLIGVVGEHEDFPIEKLALSYDQTILGSCSHDHHIKFWDVKNIYKDARENKTEDDEGEEVEQEKEKEKEGGEEEMETEGEKEKTKKRNQTARTEKKQRKGFYADL
eukprot:TRINITY_DN2533_c1_g1_i1.p1 TRINITY_DN2533_c1_g1~~TRINITY_DN2533_c1_g1_i1.p1  ORF type:complete len:280 (-),score=75.70 TRINITY_DN2533_c1_g1_i1:173-1012(-)